ncbi:MAG: hypothetical protein ACOCXZ_03085 [Chloroflexota bacterium]
MSVNGMVGSSFLSYSVDVQRLFRSIIMTGVTPAAPLIPLDNGQRGKLHTPARDADFGQRGGDYGGDVLAGFGGLVSDGFIRPVIGERAHLLPELGLVELAAGGAVGSANGEIN